MNQVSERASRIAQELSKLTAAEHYRLVLNEERTSDITASKIGGLPYWPENRVFPVDANGNKMLLLLQVNCEQAAFKDPLPEHGMLQWFISVDPMLMYGCQGNYDASGNGFRIVYHETVDQNNAVPADVPTHDTVDPMLSPVKHEVAVDVAVEPTAIGVNDGHFNRLFFDIVEEITGIRHTHKQWYQYLDNDDCLYYEQNLGMKRPCHQMLGYPVYSQDEIRRDLDRHDTLLFQLDSQFSKADGMELVMWGDMGSGFIFVNCNDLQRRIFDNAFYCWDCG